MNIGPRITGTGESLPTSAAEPSSLSSPASNPNVAANHPQLSGLREFSGYLAHSNIRLDANVAKHLGIALNPHRFPEEHQKAINSLKSLAKSWFSSSSVKLQARDALGQLSNQPNQRMEEDKQQQTSVLRSAASALLSLDKKSIGKLEDIAKSSNETRQMREAAIEALQAKSVKTFFTTQTERREALLALENICRDTNTTQAKEQSDNAHIWKFASSALAALSVKDTMAVAACFNVLFDAAESMRENEELNGELYASLRVHNPDPSPKLRDSFQWKHLQSEVQKARDTRRLSEGIEKDERHWDLFSSNNVAPERILRAQMQNTQLCTRSEKNLLAVFGVSPAENQPKVEKQGKELLTKMLAFDMALLDANETKETLEPRFDELNSAAKEYFRLTQDHPFQTDAQKDSHDGIIRHFATTAIRLRAQARNEYEEARRAGNDFIKESGGGRLNVPDNCIATHILLKAFSTKSPLNDIIITINGQGSNRSLQNLQSANLSTKDRAWAEALLREWQP